MKTIKILSFYLIILGILAGGCSSKKENTEPEEIGPQTEETSDSLTTAEINNDDTAPIASGVECVGKVELPPQAKYSIHAKVNGYVKSVYLIEGQPVKKGAVLAVIESPDFAMLQKEFLRASANYQFAKDNYDRKVKLSESQSVSEKELQKAEMELKAANADFIGLKAELELMGFQPLEIEKGTIQKNLAIISPTSGYVTMANINNGQKISPDDLLFEIIDRSQVHIKMQVNSKDVRQLKEGDKFLVTIPGEKLTFTGKLHYINKQIEPETNTVIIHGHLDNLSDANNLLVGSMVFIKF